jgi:hypothetical protein
MPNNKKNKPAKQDTRPAESWDVITQTALKAQKLAEDNAATLGNRVKPAFITSFAADIALLGTAVPGAVTAKKGAVQLTAAQITALETGHNLVTGVRTAVKGQSPTPDVGLAYGVGVQVYKSNVKSVRSALDGISKRIAAQSAEAEAFGITTEDATAINDAITTIDKADTAAAQARAKAPKSTKDRNAAARRLIAGIKLIAGAGMRAFAADATKFANFAALVKKGE